MTDTAFLSSKFTLAALPEIALPRVGLLPVYNAAANSRFIYVSAPAGSGKTVSTLLWLGEMKHETVWVGLDKYDSAPSVFFKQLSLGLFSAQPENIGMLAILNNAGFSASPIESTIALINEMHPEETPRALVLDDLHLINNAEIFKAIPFIIRRLPNNFTTIMLSRFAPPPELLPLISKKNLISKEMLSFSEKEIRTFFGILGKRLTPEQSKAVYSLTEGWVMGVNAVAHSVSREADDGKTAENFDFSDYFESQIWGQWEDSLRTFCLNTAVLDEFDPELARVMTGRDDAAVILEELSRTNSFLSCLHDDVYRYHHLFQDFLRMKTAGLTSTSALCKKAAEYYKEQGDYTRALRYMMNSGDWKSIDGYILLFLFRNNRGGVADYAAFLRTFFDEGFPDKAYKDMPALHVLAAWYYYITGYYEEFAVHMDAIIKKLPQIAKAGNEFIEFSILAFSVDHRKTMAQKERLYGLFAPFLKRYTPEGLATKIASYTQGLPLISRSNVDYNEWAVEPDWRKNLDRTFAPLLGDEWVYLKPLMDACFAYERAQFEIALELVLEAERVITPAHKIEGRISAAFLHHALLFNMGKTAEAEQAMQTLRHMTETEAQDFQSNLKAYKARLKIYDGDEKAAQKWLEEYFVIKTDHIELFRVFIHFTTARAYLAVGRLDDARSLIDMLIMFGKNLNRPLDECEAQVLAAILASIQKRRDDAEMHLENALNIMYRYGYILSAAAEGIAIEPILRRINAKLSTPDYTGTLPRSYVNEVLLAAHATAKKHPYYLMRYTGNHYNEKPIKLSPRQKDIITLLSQGMRTSEICAITELSLSTVKTHLYFAYQKLGVTNAMDAVLKARELKLI